MNITRVLQQNISIVAYGAATKQRHGGENIDIEWSY